MAKKSTVTIHKWDQQNGNGYEVVCDSPNHDGGFAMAETMAEARELKKSPENWCMGCNSEKNSSNNPNMGRQFNGGD
jgi:hypothetical protein